MARMRWSGGGADYIKPTPRAAAYDAPLGGRRGRDANAGAAGEMPAGIELHGQDQQGRNWSATVYGPAAENNGDAALRDLTRAHDDHCAGLRSLQRTLDAHYAK